MVVAVSWNITVSVISRTSRSGARSVTARTAGARPRRSSPASCCAERLTSCSRAIPSRRSRPASRLRAGLLEDPSTDRQMTPVSSATARTRSAPRVLVSGAASERAPRRPIATLVARSMIGWYSRSNSPRARLAAAPRSVRAGPRSSDASSARRRPRGSCRTPLPCTWPRRRCAAARRPSPSRGERRRRRRSRRS